MHKLIERLEKRGWNEKEIVRAVEIIHNAKQLKTPETRFLEKRVYWVLLFVIIAGNFAVSVAIVPALVALKGPFLYALIGLIGFVFGLLYELVIRGIEHLGKTHHIMLAIIIPMTALANFFVVSNMSNRLANELSVGAVHNSLAIAAVYSASLVLPYIIYRFVLRKDYYSANNIIK